MKNILVVFSGKAQSGKSTSSKILKEIIQKNNPECVVTIYSFANKIKELAKDLFDWNGSKELFYPEIPSNADVEEYYKEQEPIRDKGRQLLINIGQQMRWIRPTVWAEYAIKQINIQNSLKSENQIFIIDDLRFKNELDIVKTFNNCVSVRLSRPEELKINDISELDMDGVELDYSITNNSSMDILSSNLTGLFEKIKLKYE